MTPAIASMICETIVSNLTCSKNKNFIDKRREFYKFKDMSDEERNEVIAIDKKYGKITCLCNLISEGEIVDSIRRPLGARTVEGVKRRTGATFGSCHGAHRISKIIYILANSPLVLMIIYLLKISLFFFLLHVTVFCLPLSMLYYPYIWCNNLHRAETQYNGLVIPDKSSPAIDKYSILSLNLHRKIPLYLELF